MMINLSQTSAISAIVAQFTVALVNGAIVATNPSINSAINAANSTSLEKPGIGVHSDFPPGPKPPTDPWPVYLRYTDLDTPTSMSFAHFSDVEPRNETQLELALQKALYQCSQPRLRTQLMEPLEEYFWSETWKHFNMRVTVIAASDPPSREKPHKPVGLTFNVFLNCLIAINRFRLAYPGVYFTYDIFIDAGGYQNLFVGSGEVQGAQWEPGLQATASKGNETIQLAS